MARGHRSRRLSRRRSVVQSRPTIREDAAPLSSIRKYALGRELVRPGVPLALSPGDEVALSAFERGVRDRARFLRWVPAKQRRSPMASRALGLTHALNVVPQISRQDNLYRAWVCWKRKVRREVLFARLLMRKRGGGGGSFRRFSLESFVRCR